MYIHDYFLGLRVKFNVVVLLFYETEHELTE